MSSLSTCIGIGEWSDVGRVLEMPEESASFCSPVAAAAAAGSTVVARKRTPSMTIRWQSMCGILTRERNGDSERTGGGGGSRNEKAAAAAAAIAAEESVPPLSVSVPPCTGEGARV